MSLKDWEKINITRNEVSRIGEALKDETFRKMFVDYCEEIADPENRKTYESEITQLEKERGVDVTFINPEPGYVIKTSSDGTTKTFINIATSDKVDKPSSTTTTNANGQRGINWSLPYTLAPPRRDLDKKSQVCHVYDVVFHPDTLHLASRNAPFRQLVHDTAIDAVEKINNIKLDRANLKFPKISYKGLAKPTVIRKRIVGFDHGDVEPSPIDSIYPPMPVELKDNKVPVVEPSLTSVEFTVPKYKIVQRRGVELSEMTHEIDAKVNLTVPSELVVTIDLPLLKTSQDATLDVNRKRIFLLSEKPAKYRLDINLPYEVREENGSAKFDKDKRQLVVTLPVVMEKKLKITDFQREDSGIESDPRAENSDERESPVNVELENPEPRTSHGSNFLESTTDYVLPSFTFNQIEEILAFTLHVKNVDPASIVIERKDLLNTAQIKFSSIGAGFFPIHYSFAVKFPSAVTGIFREITAEAWDNNVIFQFELNNYDFAAYEAGLDEQDFVSYDIAEKLSSRHPSTSQGEEIEDDSLSIEVREETKNQLVIEVTRKDSESETKSHSEDFSEDVFEEETEKRQTKKSVRKRSGGRAKKMRSMSESYCDELKVINEIDSLKLEENESKKQSKKARSVSESSDDHESPENASQSHDDHKYKSILKCRSSISECNASSVEFYSMSADFGICQSHDSLSESCKKTVRFSDTIKKQIFRSNTSILAQKKKNQKKKASRKRALDRRHSEGSESEKHDEDFDEKEDAEDVGSFEDVTDSMKAPKRDSGVDLSEKPKVQVKNRKSNAEPMMIGAGDIHFKSGLIFDLEM